MDKTVYIAPTCMLVGVKVEYNLMRTSRDSIAGKEEGSVNKDKEHYDDPTGNISGMDGGESLSKENSWSVPIWND
ncbi:MAG: hypothetical protein K6A82_03990 [Prevotella sp.]|nr:hypothetical protein [Prevotella sp.]